MSYRAYTVITAAFFLVLTLTVALLNWRVDPYLMLGVDRIDGFNRIKPVINEYARMSKSYHPTFQSWDTLIVGNSRVEMGLDPRHHCFVSGGSRVYNLGVPGALLKQQLEYALNIIYEQPVQRVFLSVDFVDFLTLPMEVPAEFTDWGAPSGSLRYVFNGDRNPAYRSQRLLDHYQALFSLDALGASISTFIQQTPGKPNRSDQGFNPAEDFFSAVAVEGPAALFSQKMVELNRKYSAPWRLRYESGDPVAEYAVLMEFLRIAALRDIQVIVFTNPFHEQFWAMLRKTGLYPLHKTWLSDLRDYLAGGRFDNVTLWDFSSDHRFSNESVPAMGTTSEPLAWFWEPAHYRGELGDKMLDSMLSQTCGSPADFGKLLLPPAD